MKNLLCLLAIASLVSVATPHSAQAQDEYLTPEEDLSTHLISVGLLGGSLLPHYDFMRTYQRDNVTGITLSIEKVLKGNWADQFSFISRGIEVAHSTLGHSELLGRSTHVICYANLGIHSKGKGRLKFGLGLGILTEKFDLEDNYKNIAIGSRSNGTLIIEYSYPVYTFKQYTIVPSLKITHFSNAAFMLPNLGLNFLHAGIKVQWGLKNYAVSQTVRPQVDVKNRLTLTASLGRNESKYIGQEANLNVGANLQWVRPVNKFIYGLGLDVHHAKEWNTIDPDAIPTSELNQLESTVRFGSSVILGLRAGNTELHLTTGLYLHDELAQNGTIYNRLYILTSLSEKLGLRMRFGLKAHKSKAETLEIGLSKDLYNR